MKFKQFIKLHPKLAGQLAEDVAEETGRSQANVLTSFKTEKRPKNANRAINAFIPILINYLLVIDEDKDKKSYIKRFIATCEREGKDVAQELSRAIKNHTKRLMYAYGQCIVCRNDTLILKSSLACDTCMNVGISG